jgi:hypothetical protein
MNINDDTFPIIKGDYHKGMVMSWVTFFLEDHVILRTHSQLVRQELPVPY